SGLDHLGSCHFLRKVFSRTHSVGGETGSGSASGVTCWEKCWIKAVSLSKYAQCDNGLMVSGLSGVVGPGKDRPVSNSKGVKPKILLTEECTDINVRGSADNQVNFVCAQILANFSFRVWVYPAADFAAASAASLPFVIMELSFE
ncbi:MAG: hypothetical protein ACRC6F_02405, partial [Aeromonas sp.]